MMAEGAEKRVMDSYLFIHFSRPLSPLAFPPLPPTPFLLTHPFLLTPVPPAFGNPDGADRVDAADGPPPARFAGKVNVPRRCLGGIPFRANFR